MLKYFLFFLDTPLKINMEHNHGGRSFSFPNGWFLGSMLIFQGVSWIYPHKARIPVSTFRWVSDELIFRPGIPPDCPFTLILCWLGGRSCGSGYYIYMYIYMHVLCQSYVACFKQQLNRLYHSCYCTWYLMFGSCREWPVWLQSTHEWGNVISHDSR